MWALLPRAPNLRRVEVLHEVGSCPTPDSGTVVTIGAYDGVHLGHQAVIAAVRARAEAGGMESAVVTFDRHPAAVVRPESAPRLLTDLDQKLELLARTAIDRLGASGDGPWPVVDAEGALLAVYEHHHGDTVKPGVVLRPH